MRTIDLTPTWGEVGNIIWRFATSNEQAAFPADWANQPRNVAGYLRNEVMAWYSSKLIAFWDGKSRGTRHMVELAQREGLDIRVVKY